ncbi:hypothetical protein J6590_060246 [Homalodisca vitripennis]|nr:hypothetical protein J6590_060246 [Homalodisca vitripennis]
MQWFNYSTADVAIGCPCTGSVPTSCGLPNFATKAVKEHRCSFILLVTHSTDRILPENADSVKMLSQVTMSRV